MLARGLSASDVKNRLGHDNLQSTMTYLHLDLNLRRHIQKRYINYMQSVIKPDPKIEELLQWESDKDMIAWLESL
jgi:integrase/recombinase XerD